MFKNKKNSDSSAIFGVYSICDPEIPDCKYSPPFFSPSDSVACQALLETLRRRCTSCEQLYSSAFSRMILFRIGSVDLRSGDLLKHRRFIYKVCQVGEFLSRDDVRRFLSSVPFGDDSK